jgi:hypothetical protein
MHLGKKYVLLATETTTGTHSTHRKGTRNNVLVTNQGQPRPKKQVAVR